MTFRRQTSQILDDEHRASLALYGRLERALASRDREAVDRLGAALARHLHDEVIRHFGFEERELFPLLANAGEGDIAELLAEEHAAVREIAEVLYPLAKAGPASLSDTEYETFRRHALELVERQVAHIQKESMALLPMLDDLIDDETDRVLSLSGASG